MVYKHAISTIVPARNVRIAPPATGGDNGPEPGNA
jgi:host factor-I protein